MTLKYREPKSGEALPVPPKMLLSPREEMVLQFDIELYDPDTEGSHWQLVAQAMNEEHPGLGEQTEFGVYGVKRRFMEKIRKFALVRTANALLAQDLIPHERSVTIDDRKALALKVLQSTYDNSQKHEPLYTDYRKVLVVSDYHGGVHAHVRENLLLEDYDIAVHLGDIFDQWGLHQARISGKSLTRQEKVTTLDEEMQEMRAWFELLDEHTNAQHIVLMGNHDARLYSLFVQYLDPVLRSESLLHQMFKTPLELLTEGLENVGIGNRDMIWSYPDQKQEWAANSQFLYQMGDALFSHMNFTGKVPGTAVNKLWQWIQDYQQVLQLEDIRCCFQAHTHSLMLDRNAQGGHVALVETGCAMPATALGYGLVYNGNWTPSAVGYILFDQYLEDGNWRTDLNSIELKGVC